MLTPVNRRQFFHAMLAAAWLDDSVIANKADWQAARAKLLAGMQSVMGKVPALPKSAPKVMRITSEELPAFTRIKLTYESEPGDAVAAWLLIPRNLKRRTPGLLCLHQTTKIGKDEPAGLGGNANLQYARELAERGYVCLAPDYPYLGENNFDPYAHGYLSCTMKGIVNHRRAVDVLQALPEVNKAHIGCVGHSLGGHNTLFVAAFDERIKAIVTSCGFTAFASYFNGNLAGWAGNRYMPLIAQKYGNNPAQMPFDFPQLLAGLAPRPLFISAPLRDNNFEVSGVRACVSVAKPVYERVFNAGERLVAEYPDAPHDFPTPVRIRAYEFLDRWLKG